MRILVTGATGLLGNNIVRQLAAAGHQPVALVRQKPAPEVFSEIDSQGAKVEIVQGQFADDGTETTTEQDKLVDQWIDSCDAVVHCAALIQLGWTRLEESLRVNCDGTRRIAHACRRQNKKLIYIGTVNSIALGSRQTVADEDTPLGHAGGQVGCSYVQSKRAAIAEVESAIAGGLNAVIIHPGFMLGPWDWKPSSGRMLLEIGKGWKPIAPRGGCSVCDVRDVASGVITAITQRCKSGRHYVLAGHNWTYRHLWSEMARRMGSRPPVRTLGPGVEYLAGLAGDLWTRWKGSEGDLNSAQITMSGQFHWYSSDRAKRELNYHIRSAEETLDDAANWVHDRFILSREAPDR